MSIEHKHRRFVSVKSVKEKVKRMTTKQVLSIYNFFQNQLKQGECTETELHESMVGIVNDDNLSIRISPNHPTLGKYVLGSEVV